MFIEHGYELRLAFDPHLQDLINESALINQLGYTLPDELVQLHLLKNIIKTNLSTIHKTYSAYRSTLSKMDKADVSIYIIILISVYRLI